MLRGALAAAVTPLRDGGEALDEEAFAPYVDFLAAGGVDGLLALGTTGEGFLLPVEQRMRSAQLFVEAAHGRLQVAVHTGAQSTWDTVELAAHAADVGADAVGAVSALGSAFPELVAAAVRDPASADLAPVRLAMERFPFQSALKTVLAQRGVPINPDVRRPLRTLTDEERAELEAWLESSSPAPAR